MNRPRPRVPSTGRAAVIALVAFALLLLVAVPFALNRFTDEGEEGRTSPFSRCVAAPASPTSGLEDQVKLDMTRRLVSSAENSSLAWEAQYGYIEYNVEGNEAENRGYTAGLAGFTSKTHDMLLLVRQYTKDAPRNPLARYLPALEKVDGTSSRRGLGPGFERAWKKAANDETFRRAQRNLMTSMYYAPAIAQAKEDGLGALGQYAYVDAMIVHGPGEDPMSFGGIRQRALDSGAPGEPGDTSAEKRWLSKFLDARAWAMQQEQAHSDLSRVETQRAFLRSNNLGLMPPLTWTMYGDRFHLFGPGTRGCR